MKCCCGNKKGYKISPQRKKNNSLVLNTTGTPIPAYTSIYHNGNRTTGCGMSPRIANIVLYLVNTSVVDRCSCYNHRWLSYHVPLSLRVRDTLSYGLRFDLQTPRKPCAISSKLIRSTAGLCDPMAVCNMLNFPAGTTNSGVETQ